MRWRMLRSSAAGTFRWLMLLGAGVAAVSCHEPLDATRRAPPKATLGDDVFGMLCDRVGASSLNEDALGASYQRVCHYDDSGHYEDKVDVSALPPVSGERAEQARRRGIAKIEAMARWRSDLIRAVNAAVPDIEIKNVAPGEGGGKIRLHDAVLSLSQTVTPLYETNPLDPEGEPVVPASTDAIGRLFHALIHGHAARPVQDGETSEARARREERARIEAEREATLERQRVACDDLTREWADKGKRGSLICQLPTIWGRRGYRSFHVGLGAVRAALAYPDLRRMTVASLDVLGPGGPGAPALQGLFRAAERELFALEPEPRAPLDIDAATGQPSRPRTTLELVSAVALAEHSSFAAEGAPPSYLVARRDRRGWVVPDGGGAPPPFADVDGDGLADVDAFGRFVDPSGAPLAIDPPFAIPGITLPPEDAFGRLSPELYTYLDTSRLLAGAAPGALLPLLDATKYAGDRDPEPWNVEHEGLMYALAGSYVLFGDREDALYDVDGDTVEPAGAACARCLPYRRFRGEDSPLADLAHAVGQVLADKDSDVLLLGLMDLLEDHEDVLARLAGAALRIRDIAREHDRLAALGKEPPAQIADGAPLWDEIAAVLDLIVEQPGLVARLVKALGSDALVTPRDGSRHFGDALSAMFRYRDQLTYNPEAVNGPAINLTVGAPSTADPRTPVDLTEPRAGDNRSCMERLMQLIHDTAGVRQCNKEGATVSVFGVSVPFVEYAECELFEINNLAAYYLDSLLPEDHAKRTELKIKPSALDVVVTDSVLSLASGLDGMTRHPTSGALGRLIFFGADSQRYPDLPDLDPLRTLANETTNLFISGTLEPAGTVHCPRNAAGVHACSSPADLLRMRNPNTIFLTERLGLGAYMSHIVGAFAEVTPDDYSGEELLIDLLRTAYRHWPGERHGPECSKEGTPGTNTAYCSEAGINTYEPLLADALQADDVMASTVAFASAAADPSSPARITVRRGPDAGLRITKADVFEKLARVVFSTRHAASVAMVDRRGNKKARWADGKVQPQLTPFTLLADAVNAMDARFDESDAPGAAARRGQWERAKDELLDAFLAVEGRGAEARFKNRAVPKIAGAVLGVLREQLNARCPDRESTGECAWAREELGRKVADLLSHPLFAALIDVMESIRADEPARRELERFLAYLFDERAAGGAYPAMIAMVADALQLAADEDTLIPMLNAASAAVTPAGEGRRPGAAVAGLDALKALQDDRYDRYHVMDHILPALVTPMENDPRAPLQIFLDAFADVNRLDAASTAPLSSDDYRQLFISARDFMHDKTRGLEQIYEIVRNRPRE